MEPLPHSGFEWHELMTTDADKAEAFYAEVAGISVMRLGDGEDAYRMVTMNGHRSVGWLVPVLRDRSGRRADPSLTG